VHLETQQYCAVVTPAIETANSQTMILRAERIPALRWMLSTVHTKEMSIERVFKLCRLSDCLPHCSTNLQICPVALWQSKLLVDQKSARSFVKAVLQPKAARLAKNMFRKITATQMKGQTKQRLCICFAATFLL